MDGTHRVGVRRWLSAARHPGRRDGVIAAALLALPWVVGWALAPHNRLDATAVTILVTLTVPLAGLWLTWAAFRTASRVGLADSGASRGGITAGPGSVVADHGGIAFGFGSVVADCGGTAVGQVVYQQRWGVTGKPVRLADTPPLLAGREGLLSELDARLAGGDGLWPRTVALWGLGGAGNSGAGAIRHHRPSEEQRPRDSP